MQQLFSQLRDELKEIRDRGYTGATAYAIDLELQYCDKRYYGDGDRSRLRTTALEAFWLFHQSECKFESTYIVKLRTYLCRWLDEVTRNPAEIDFKFDRLRCILARGLEPGPGTSIGRHGRTTSAYHKLTSRASVSSVGTLMEYLSLERLRPDLKLARGREGFEISPGSRVTTVAKDSGTDRVITIQPDVNVRLQSALGGWLSNVLLKLGIDLSTQPLKNRHLARQGSIDGQMATVDLKRASDTILKDVLEGTLPSWLFHLICAYTSPFVDESGQIISGRIFLTMGNGITFPLQTLFFLAVCHVACDEVGIKPAVNQNIAVFGDDLIVPSAAYPKLREILTSLGCIVNETKSFYEGPFRESCGADWFNGFNVRPFMPKGNPLRDAGSIASLYNLTTMWESRVGVDLPRFKESLLAYAASAGWTMPIVPMHAPITGGLRVVIPTTDHHVRINRHTISYVYHRYQSPLRYLPNEGHPYVIQAVMAGYLACPERRRVPVHANAMDATDVPPIVLERPRVQRLVRVKGVSCLPWASRDRSDEWMYEGWPSTRQIMAGTWSPSSYEPYLIL